MGMPAAKQGDKIIATDIHQEQMISPPNTPQMTPKPFNGVIDGGLSSNVNIMGLPAAVAGSTATNSPGHPPTPNYIIVKPPTNKGTIAMGSSTVFINNKPAARCNDTAITCNDPVDQPIGTVVAVGTVMIG